MPYLKVDAHGQKVPFFWIIWQSRAEVAIFGKKKKKKKKCNWTNSGLVQPVLTGQLFYFLKEKNKDSIFASDQLTVPFVISTPKKPNASKSLIYHEN